METLLEKVYQELKYLKKVKNQTDFGDKLGYNKSYTSTLLRSVTPLSRQITLKLEDVYGISRNWLVSEGKCDTDTWGKPLQAATLTNSDTPGSALNNDYRTLKNQEDMNRLNDELVRHLIEMNRTLVENNSTLTATNSALANKIPDYIDHQGVKNRLAV